MNTNTLADLLEILMMLHQGRTQAAADALAVVIRFHGGCVPTGPAIEGPKPAPQPEKPLWMRPGA